jgi:hypothetical protein
VLLNWSMPTLLPGDARAASVTARLLLARCDLREWSSYMARIAAISLWSFEDLGSAERCWSENRQATEATRRERDE